MAARAVRRVTATSIGVACLCAAAIAPAGAAETDGPAWVDQLGSQLLPLRDAGPGDVARARDAGLQVEGGAVAVDVVVSGDPDAARDRLEAAGMDVVATATEPRPAIEGYLPLDAINAAGRLGSSEAVLPVIAGGIDSGGTDVGAVTSLGVTRHNIPAAIAAAGTSGAGVDVGVISDSINRVGGGVAGSQGSGDLPLSTEVLKDGEPGDSDEGRAMAEIIYDEAPGLNRLIFASGTNAGAVDKADSINQLAAAGADVIADDIFYLSEPFFQDGVIAQAVDAARAGGVAYLASAGNRGRQSYESTFRPSGSLHDFDPGPGVDTRNCLTGTVPTGGFIQVALGWDEPVGGVTTDLDIRITNPGGIVLASAVTANIATGDPKDIVTFSNSGAAVQPCIEIQRFAGSATPFIKWIERHSSSYSPVPAPEFATNSDTINPDAASAQGSLTVAAVDQADPGLDTPESFSSRGPKTRYFDAAGNRYATPLVLNKPQLAAADKVGTTVPGFATFAGTSAATPSAAGIATILRSLNPQATVQEIYATMTDPANAIDCTSSALVPDPDCGAGFILADRAVAALDRSGAVVGAAISPAKATGKHGWYTKKKQSVSVSWTVTDPESAIESTSGCGATDVSKDGKVKLTCDAVSGGGPGSATVTIKRDTKPPSKPKLKGLKPGRPLPPKNKLKCKAKDKTSGIAKCKIKGYSASPGSHKLKLTATDKAGLKSKATVRYTLG